MIENNWLSSLWLHSIHWREPLFLLFALQPFILFLIQKLSNKKKLSRYADADLQAWVSWQHTKKSRSWLSWITTGHALYIMAWLLLSISIAGPRLLLEQPGSADQARMNIMLVVDVSRSMHSRDVEPDRLRRVQIEINELLQTAANNRFGLIIYTARAHLYVPFTDDINALKYYLKLMDSIPLPTSGSSPSTALALARTEIEQANYNNNSAVLWFTDGDFENESFKKNNSSHSSAAVDKLLDAANKLAQTSIPLYILGVGSSEGDAIPMTDGGWLEYQGRPVISRMNEKLLNKLADIANGDFIIAQNDDSDWYRLYHRGLAASTHLESNTVNEKEAVWRELYTWTLFPAILLLFASLIPYRFNFSRFNFIMAGKNLLLPYFLVLSLSPLLQPIQARADEQIQSNATEIEQQAYNYFINEKFTLAAEFYHQLSGYQGRLGEANSHYRLGQFPQAIAQLNQAVLLARTDQQRGVAIYNLANSTFKTGDYAAAATLYRDALRYRPEHDATKTNLALSLSLQQLIDDQIQQGTANRMGSGPKSARAQQGLDINDSGSMSFDNEEQRLHTEIALPEIPVEELELLLTRGLAHIRLANINQANPAIPANQAGKIMKQHDINAAHLRMRELEDRQQLLWKRLFEMEEGFAASLDKAEAVPGVFPW